MEISVFEGANKNELSMIEVAHAILEQRGDVMDFSDLANEIQTYLGKSDSDIRDSLAQFYTDLNIDGSFISLGDNRWGLRSWYAIDSIDEEVNHGIDEEDEDTPRRRKRKKVNAFINDDEDAIDYNDDDPEDTDLSDEDDDDLFEDEDDDDEEIAAYNSDLQEIGADTGDDEEEIPGNIEEDLSIIEDDDEEDEEFEDEDFPEE
ncbi:MULTISPECIES: DNA-directed RNA polymerase subunit delta [Enterococcus]|uniref:Probable DNA-directed RNA polymerase subunit delta n=1 Tax=Enterococcus mundtii TaxID=53346 RepID=A0A1A6GA80_ENTMU|nr:MULTISPECIES: DNA-directed RNA polymerase subunit delta [Enterococcus]MBE6172649.1 DNA-directed RNA polymerase subunit delta [Enterococcus faecium]MBE9909725.1 DNA-directed RNA polymerase subunit delta [Enterococcus mundtii]MBO1084757.1 DNA-directed RNA polymerase subunit delta [Enterococcus mundtii]MCA6772965.1 DNA-directed RNA polymerase subunit delta [Enterococcus mundtii]MDB7101095.1 DNA-directed RNA polymerase subunit delta [Enterococcus mundtii]